MAQIPVFRPDQIIEQGSPMEIGNSGVYMGDAIQTLGKGLGELTEVMYKEQLKTKQRIDDDLLKLNNENTKQYMARLAKVAESTELDENDPYGFKAADELQKSAKGFIQKNYERLLKTTDAATARKYMASAVEDLTVLDAKALASRGEKQLKFVEQNQQVFSNALIAQAREGEDLDVLRVKYLDSIMDNPTIPDVEKPRLVSEFDKSIKQSKLEGLLDQGKAGDYTAFGRAENMAKELAKSGSHDYKFTKDMQDLVESTKLKTIDYDYKVFNRSKELLEQEQKDAMLKAYNFYIKELAAAGNNDSKVQAILAKAQQDSAFNINPQARKELEGISVFKEMADDKYQLNLVNQVTTNKISIKAAQERVMQDALGKNATVSLDRATKLQSKLKELEKDDANWAPAKGTFASSKQFIMSHYGADFRRDPNGYIDDAGQRMRAATAVAEFSVWFNTNYANGVRMSPSTIHKKAFEIVNKTGVVANENYSNVSQIEKSNRGILEKSVREETKKYMNAKDPKAKKAIGDRLQNLTNELNKLNTIQPRSEVDTSPDSEGSKNRRPR